MRKRTEPVSPRLSPPIWVTIPHALIAPARRVLGLLLVLLIGVAILSLFFRWGPFGGSLLGRRNGFHQRVQFVLSSAPPPANHRLRSRRPRYAPRALVAPDLAQDLVRGQLGPHR
jgi:hypothetical protein